MQRLYTQPCTAIYPNLTATDNTAGSKVAIDLACANNAETSASSKNHFFSKTTNLSRYLDVLSPVSWQAIQDSMDCTKFLNGGSDMRYDIDRLTSGALERDSCLAALDSIWASSLALICLDSKPITLTATPVFRQLNHANDEPTWTNSPYGHIGTFHPSLRLEFPNRNGFHPLSFTLLFSAASHVLDPTALSIHLFQLLLSGDHSTYDCGTRI